MRISDWSSDVCSSDRHAEAAERDIDTNPFWRSELTARPDWYANGVRNGLGGPSGELAALFTPELALDLADWLDHHARLLVAAGHPDADSPLARRALAVARRFLGEPGRAARADAGLRSGGGQ